MARQYKLKQFVRYLDDALIAEYLQAKSIRQELPPKHEKETPADYWERFIRNLPQGAVNVVEVGFQEINELADEGGVLSLIQIGSDHGVDIAGEIKDIENPYNQAFHCYLKHPKIFEEAATLYWIEELRSKKERTGLRSKTAKEVMERKGALAEALREYFITHDGRGTHCQIDVHSFQGRVCFVAYPEDYAKSDFHYEGEQLRRASRRPCFEVVFIYYPNTGRLELWAKGGKDREKELLDIFNHQVLEDKNPLDPSQKVYDLNRLFDENLVLAPQLEDQIEDIRVKQMRFDFKFGGRQRITLEMDQEGGLKPMQELMKKKGISAEYFNITQARIHIKFPGKGKKGSVTLQITAPDKCNLNSSPLHLKAEKYLKLWNLENTPVRETQAV